MKVPVTTNHIWIWKAREHQKLHPKNCFTVSIQKYGRVKFPSVYKVSWKNQ